MGIIDLPDQGNGKSAARRDPFDDLSNVVLALAAAKNRQEAMARVAASQRMIKSIKELVIDQEMRLDRLCVVLLAATEGEAHQMHVNVEGDIAGYTFLDSAGQPVYVLDANLALVLVTPKTVHPIVVTVHMKDGTKKTVTVEHTGDGDGGKPEGDGSPPIGVVPDDPALSEGGKPEAG